MAAQWDQAVAAPPAAGSERYVVYFASQHNAFRLPELRGAAGAEDIDMVVHDECYSSLSPYAIIDVPGGNAAVTRLVARCVTVKLVARLLGYGATWDACLAASSTRLPLVHRSTTYKIIFESFNRKPDRERRAILLERLKALSWTGEVNMAHPDQVYCCIEDFYGIENPKDAEPGQAFFAEVVAEGGRHLLTDYSLKKRNMLGTTTMDAEMSFITANLARTRQGTFMFDPFVGTASLLLPAAHFGARVSGADIDFVTIHGMGKTSRKRAGSKTRTPTENIRSNFDQYGTRGRMIDMVVADNKVPCWRRTPLYDAIVADPPYGVREPAQTIKAREVVPQEHEAHFPGKEAYALSGVFFDLLEFAAHWLVMGGRLCYFLPEVLDAPEPLRLPSHPCLKIEANCQQPLRRFFARRLIAMVKVAEPDPEGTSHAGLGGLASDWDVHSNYFQTRRKVRKRDPEREARYAASLATETTTSAAAGVAAEAAQGGDEEKGGVTIEGDMTIRGAGTEPVEAAALCSPAAAIAVGRLKRSGDAPLAHGRADDEADRPGPKRAVLEGAAAVAVQPE